MYNGEYMARPKGVKQKRDESKYVLPPGVILKEGQTGYLKDTKLVFIDEKYGEFISSFKAIITARGSTHPKAVKERRTKTNVERYGGPNPHCSPEVHEKAKKTMEEKYGVKHALCKKEFLDKSRETLKKNYNVNHPMESSIIKERLKSSFLNKYGVDNPMKDETIKNKLRQQEIESGHIVPLSNGYTIAQYCSKLGLPFLSRAFQLRKEYGDEFVIDWLDNRKQAISSLEMLFNKIIPEAVPFQKVPNEIKGSGFRPDFIFKDTFIDVDGLLYHSEKYKQSSFHFNKREVYKNGGIKLIQFRQDELTDRPEIVKSIINIKTNNPKNRRLFARKLKIKEITNQLGNSFFERTHLMGGFIGAKCVALMGYDDVIEACISYKEIEKGIIDISRFSCNLNTLIVGGLSKLLSYIIKKENPEIIQSFVDLRYGTGESLIKLGFNEESITLGWKWTDGWQTYSRQKCMANMDERHLTEREYADELGWYKIYDAGQAKFVKYFVK